MPQVDGKAILIAIAIVAMLLVAFLTFDFTSSTVNETSGGPDPEWQSDPQPIPHLPPEGETLDGRPIE